MINISFNEWAKTLELSIDHVLAALSKYTEQEKFALMDPSSQEVVAGANGLDMLRMVIGAERCSYEKIEILKAMETPSLNIYELKGQNDNKLAMSFLSHTYKDTGRGELIQHVLENMDDMNELVPKGNGTYKLAGTYTLAHLAVGARDMQFIRASYEAGMDYSIKTKGGKTPLEIAQANAIMDNGEFLREFIAFNVSIRLPLSAETKRPQIRL